MAKSKEQASFEKFINGDFGLAKTFWIFLVLANILFKVFIFLIEKSIDSYSFTVLAIFWFIYQLLALIATTKAIEKYQGKKIWKIFAKIAVVLAWFGYLISILQTIVAISDYFAREEITKPNKIVVSHSKKKELAPIVKNDYKIQNYYDLMLIDAIDKNDTQKALLAIKNGANVNLSAKNFENIGTLLMIATLKNNKKIVQALIKNGANVLYKNSRGNSFLHVACQNDILKIALKTKAKKYINDPVDLSIFKSYPITIALFNKQYENVKLLLKNGAKLPDEKKEKVFKYLKEKHLQDLLKAFQKYGYFKNSKKLVYNQIIPQKKINSLFLDKDIKEVVQSNDTLFITYESKSNTYLYQYEQNKDVWDLKKSFLIQDNTCLKPAIYKNYLATYCYGKKNLYLLDLKSYKSKMLHMQSDITDLIWDGDKLVSASGGFKIVWRDSNLNELKKINYSYSLIPFNVKENVKEHDFNLANVHLRKKGDIILAFSRYFSILIDTKSKKILHSNPNIIPMGMSAKKYYYLKSWDDFFKDKRNLGVFVSADDAWLVKVENRYFVNILVMGKVIIWQWPIRNDKNIAIINYDLNKIKRQKIGSKKYFPKKYAGSLKDKVGKVGFFYTSKGFEVIHYGKNLQDIKLLSYAKKPNYEIKSYFYDKLKNEIHLLAVQFDTDLDEFDISLKGNNFYFAYEPEVNLPKGYLNGFLKDNKFSFMLRRKFHLSKWQNDKKLKEVLTTVKHPWYMKKCEDTIAIYGAGNWYGLDVLDKNLNHIAYKYKKQTVKALSCFKNKKILSLPEEVVLYNGWQKEPKVLAKLSGLLDESFAVGFVKGVPFYAGRKDNILALHIMDKKEKTLKLDFTPIKAFVKDSYIALIGDYILIVQYKDKVKKVAKIEGIGLGWWKNFFIYSKNGAIYKYNIATNESNKLLNFDIKEYQGNVEDSYIQNNTLVYVMSDMYAVLVNLESKKVTIEQFFKEE